MFFFFFKFNWSRQYNDLDVHINDQELWVQFNSVTQSWLSDSLWPHGLQHARLPCQSGTLGILNISKILDEKMDKESEQIENFRK